MAGAPKGNNNAEKFKTPEERAELLAAVCKHLEEGLSKECFAECDWDTVERYMKEFPIEFPAKTIKAAHMRGMQFWEKVGKKQALTGEGSAAAWIFNMKNRYNWRDKSDVTTDGQPFSVNLVNFSPPADGNDNAPV
jgi:hypothetical protein